MPPLRLIAVDIDGTLLTSDFRVSERNLEALNQLHDSGVHVVLATGRRHAFTRPITSLLGFSPSVISSNGAITRSPEGKLLSKTLMPRSIAIDVLEHMQRWADQAVVTMDREGPGAMYVQSRATVSSRIARWVESNQQELAEAKPLISALTGDPVQIMFCGTVAEMGEATAYFDRSAVRGEVSCHTTQYDKRDLSIIDVMTAGCTKGHALAQLCNSLGIRADEVLAIGDNYNDVEMLEFAGHAFVVDNAHPEMKRAGWQVTRSNDEDGVAHAIAAVLEQACA